MGKKLRYIILVFLTLVIFRPARAQNDFGRTDSLTYSQYLNGDWDNLIRTGKEVLARGVDYKFLRQRIGYAYYCKADYIRSRRQYSKALRFDSFDPNSLEYLYKSYLFSGNSDGAAVIAGKMHPGMRNSLSISLFKPVESVDAEFNFKFAGTKLRSNPVYYHLGLSSRLGSRVSLYQMFSNYYQTITVRYPAGDRHIRDLQPEYYALLKVSVTPWLYLKSAWHYLRTSNTGVSVTTTSSDLFYGSVSADLAGFTIEADASVLNSGNNLTKQFGGSIGLKSPGNRGLYMASSLAAIDDGSTTRAVFSQRAGFRFTGKVWLEGNVTFGNLTDYRELSAMYIYNTLDPTSFRCGSSIYFFSGKRLDLWGNISYERKDFYENILYHYNQFSYTGGIRWKL
ncbi:MAG: hypothetical protein U0X39_12915 [Bacteroidales bacterium]